LPVIRPKVAETTALGAAYAAGLAVGFLGETSNDLRQNWGKDAEWDPKMDKKDREKTTSYGESGHQILRLDRARVNCCNRN